MHEEVNDENALPISAHSADTSGGGGEELAEWKRRALGNFSRWLDELDEIPASMEDEKADSGPDLFVFYEELAALRNEVRKGNRRLAETFGQWGGSLADFGQTLAGVEETVRRMERTVAVASPSGQQLSRTHCLALVELCDRLNRTVEALECPPPARRIFGSTAQWEKEWGKVRQGISIVRDHAESLLSQAEVRPILAERQVFDPGQMVAVAMEARPGFPPNTVLEIVSMGYLYKGEVLRPAEVKVTPRE